MAYQTIPVAEAVKAGIVDFDSRGAVWDDTTYTQGLKFANDGRVILIARSVITATDTIVEWSTAQKQAGSYSALITKEAAATDKSGHLEITPASGLTLNDLAEAIDAGTPEWSFYHYLASGDGVQNGPQFEFRFEQVAAQRRGIDHGWLEITCLPLQGYTGTDGWVKATLAAATQFGFGGHTPDGSGVFEWTMPQTLTDLLSLVNAAWDSAESGEVGTTYPLTRARVELWEQDPPRTAYIDTIVIDGVTYAIEPGIAGAKLGINTPGVTLAFTEVKDRFGRIETLAPVVGAEQSLVVGPLLPALFNDDSGFVLFKPGTTGLTVRYLALQVGNPS